MVTPTIWAMIIMAICSGQGHEDAADIDLDDHHDDAEDDGDEVDAEAGGQQCAEPQHHVKIQPVVADDVGHQRVEPFHLAQHDAGEADLEGVDDARGDDGGQRAALVAAERHGQRGTQPDHQQQGDETAHQPALRQVEMGAGAAVADEQRHDATSGGHQLFEESRVRSQGKTRQAGGMNCENTM